MSRVAGGRWIAALGCLALVTMAGCSGPAIEIPPTPTPDSSSPSTMQSNHHHGESGANGRLVTRYGGPVAVSLSTQPEKPQPATPVTITYTLKDRAGSPLTIDKLQVTHEHPMHLIVVSQDLRHFSHIHPADQGDGSYAVADTLPEKGGYLLFNEFFTLDGTAQIERHGLTTADTGPSEAAANLSPDLGRPQQVGGLAATLTAATEKVRRRAPTTFTLTLSKDGKPVTDLEPYLGAPCHVVIISADTKQFAHTHGDLPAGQEATMTQLPTADHQPLTPGMRFGPSVRFTHTFMQAGLYRVWVQIGYGGEVLTLGSNVQVNK